jgi:hypothetical protein
MDMYGQLHVPVALASDIEPPSARRLGWPLVWTTREEGNVPVTGIEPGGRKLSYCGGIANLGTSCR